MPSFDIVSEVDKQEVKNALEQVNKEVSTRFDFKGSDARVEQAEYKLTVYADDDFKLGQVLDILMAKLAAGTRRSTKAKWKRPISKANGDSMAMRRSGESPIDHMAVISLR